MRSKSSVCQPFKTIVVIIIFVVTGNAQQLATRVDEYLAPFVKEGRFSGVVLLAQEGKELFSKGYGMANLELNVANTPQMKFRIGSLTKQFTAMAILILQERGKLNVQDAVCKYVPECPPAWAGMTIHHLLTHTAGIPDLLAFPDFRQKMALPSTAEQTVRWFKDKPLEFRPGTKFNYSNSEYVLLGYIVERVSGESYETFLKENIFAPLGMSDTGGDHNDLVLPNRAAGYSRRNERTVNAPYIDMSIPVGGGSLYSTAGDLFLWDQSLYTERLVSKRALAAIFTAYATADWGDKAGYGWFMGKDRSGRQFAAHLGGINGFAASISRYPNEKGLIIVLSNFSFAPVSDITNSLADILFGTQVEIERKSASQN